MELLRIFADAQGESHFEAVEVDFSATEFVPGKPVVGLSTAYQVTGVAFARVPADWEGGWHPTPRRQIGVIISGSLDIRTGNGEVHRFTPGSVFLLEDTTGNGHNTVTAGGTDAIVLLSWLDPPH
jgi:hypothetical protein